MVLVTVFLIVTVVVLLCCERVVCAITITYSPQ